MCGSGYIKIKKNRVFYFILYIFFTLIQGFSLGHFLDKWPKDFENDLNFEDF